MDVFIPGEGLFSLRATFEGTLPQGEGMYATWTDVGAPIIVTPGLLSNMRTRTWNLSKYGDPVRWFITKPGEDETKGFHYDKIEAGSVISLGYPSPFSLELCADGTGGMFRPANNDSGLIDGNSYYIGVTEEGTVEIMNVAGKSQPTPAWQAHVIPGW
ncbi:hypothetical protein OPQ81_003122 [Rhizoctonia solani]|nr:hypothetical protein OPQ81_003122 [Rhizoctonia solani]